MADTYPISKIKVGNRQRTEQGDVDDLKESISRLDLIQPIVIDDEGNLIAGGRRLEACRQLGWKAIPVRYYSDLDAGVRMAIELEENVKRKNLPWKDEVFAIRKLHEYYSKLRGEPNTFYTAEQIGISRAQVSKCVEVAAALERGDERVAAAEGLSSAYNVVSRQIQRDVDDELARLDEVEEAPSETPTPEQKRARPADKDVLQADFLNFIGAWLKKPGRRFNFLHCDFPYGINLQNSEQGRMAQRGSYDDRPEVYWTLLDCLANNLEKLMIPSGHLFFWFSMSHYERTLATFDKLQGVKAQHFPCVWHKSDGKGIIPAPAYYGRRTYETALFITLGDRPILEPVAISYAAPTGDAAHPSQKPEPVLRHFFRMIVDGNTEMLDPTCGSGTALVAAEDLGAKRVMGLDTNKEHVEGARFRVSTARKMRLI